MRAPNGSLAASLVAFITAACSGGPSGSTPDASSADSGNTAPCPQKSCGEVCCPSVARLCAPSCACPDPSTVPTPFQSAFGLVDSTQVQDALTAEAVFTAPDGKLDTLVVGYRLDTPTGMDLVLAPAGSSGTPFAAIGWDTSVATQSTATALYATVGKVHLDSACAMGVAGRLFDLTFTEQLTVRNDSPHPSGCSFDVPEIVFAIGNPCP